MFSKAFPFRFVNLCNAGIKLTLSLRTNFKLFQTETRCGRHFKFDENGGKFFKREENVVEKGEIAR